MTQKNLINIYININDDSLILFSISSIKRIRCRNFIFRTLPAHNDAKKKQTYYDLVKTFFPLHSYNLISFFFLIETGKQFISPKRWS